MQALDTSVYKKIGLTKREYYDDNIIKPLERSFVKRFTKLGEQVVWIKRSSKLLPSGIGYCPTNDFIWRGKEWELKTSISEKIVTRTVINKINTSVDRGKRNVFLEFPDKEITTYLKTKLSEYNISRRNTITKRYVDHIVVWDKTGLYQIVLK